MAITAFRVCLHPYERRFSESVTPVLIFFIVSFGISFVNMQTEAAADVSIAHRRLFSLHNSQVFIIMLRFCCSESHFYSIG